MDSNMGSGVGPAGSGGPVTPGAVHEHSCTMLVRTERRRKLPSGKDRVKGERGEGRWDDWSASSPAAVRLPTDAAWLGRAGSQ